MATTAPEWFACRCFRGQNEVEGVSYMLLQFVLGLLMIKGPQSISQGRQLEEGRATAPPSFKPITHSDLSKNGFKRIALLSASFHFERTIKEQIGLTLLRQVEQSSEMTWPASALLF